jgi:nitrous oxidase accessory protein NosD
MRKLKLAGLVCGLFVFVLIVGMGASEIGSAQDCTLTLKPGQSIQAAIDRSLPNSIICLEPGTWDESLTITKSITLQGAARDLTILNGKGRSGNGITVKNAEPIKVRLAGLTIQNYCESAGVFVGELADVTLFNSKIANNARGIVAANAAKLNLESVQILDHKAQGLKMSDSVTLSVANSQFTNNNRCCERAAIEVNDHSSLQLTNSVVSGNRLEGIRVRHAASALITNLTLAENNRDAPTASLFVTETAHVEVIDSRFSDNGSFAMIIQGEATVLIDRSQISNNQQGGLLIGDHAQVRVQGSQISNNRKRLDHGDGLSLWGAARVQILENMISDNDGHGLQSTDMTIIEKCQDNIVVNNRKGDFEPADLSTECN